MSGIHVFQEILAKISNFMFNECFIYLRWRKHNRRANLIRNRIVFLDFQACLSLKQGRSLDSIFNMISQDWSHMFPRLEELLNRQILPSHVTEIDAIHLKKIATPKCLFFSMIPVDLLLPTKGGTNCSYQNVLRPSQMHELSLFQTCL